MKISEVFPLFFPFQLDFSRTLHISIKSSVLHAAIKIVSKELCRNTT